MTVKKSGPDTIDICVGQQIRACRMGSGITQQEMALAVGVTFQQIQKYENAQNRISASMLWKISCFLNVPVAFFFYGDMGSGS